MATLFSPHLPTQTSREREKHESEMSTYLHGKGGRLLVIVVEQVWHEGGVVGEILAHTESYGLTGECAVAFYRVNEDGRAAGEQC